VTTKYSRIPVYKKDIDNIVGVLFSKDLLDFLELPPADLPENSDAFRSYKPHMKDTWTSLSASVIMEPTFFIPEKMSAWDALQDMRKRRVHMAIVVDEYGGTAGLVSFEDILEEVVGEIYDEDDIEEVKEDLRNIFIGKDGSIMMKGIAELTDVYDALGLNLNNDEELEKTLEEYSTIGGLLCSLAGEIPKSGDIIPFSGFVFTITEVDDRRVLGVTVTVLAKKTSQKTQEEDNNSNGNSNNSYGNNNKETNKNNNEDINCYSSGNNFNNNKDFKDSNLIELNDGKDEKQQQQQQQQQPLEPFFPGGEYKTFRDGEWIEAESAIDPDNSSSSTSSTSSSSSSSSSSGGGTNTNSNSHFPPIL
jgi:Mg2+/Co2+ transporter CorC